MNKKELAQKAVELIKTVVVNRDSSVKKAIENIYPQKNSDFSFTSFIDDEDTIAFMKEYGLNSPEKIIKFFVNVHFATIESIFSGIGEIQQDLLDTNGLSFISDAEIKYEKKMYQDAEKDLIHGFSVINLAIKNSVNRIRSIDDLKGLEFAVKAVFGNRGKAETATKIAKMSINGLFEIISLSAILYSEIKSSTNNPPDNVLYGKCNELMDYLLSGDICRLMHSFDSNKKDGYWLNLPNKIKAVQKENSELRAFIDAINDDDNESYENIIL